MSLFKKTKRVKVLVKPLAVEDVKLLKTTINKGKTAPPGCVFYNFSLSYAGMKYGQTYTINRSKMDDEQEQRYIDKTKAEFLEDVKTKYKL